MPDRNEDSAESKPGGRRVNRRKVIHAIAGGTTGLATGIGVGSAGESSGGHQSKQNYDQIGDLKYRFYGCREVCINRLSSYVFAWVDDDGMCIVANDWQRTDRNDLDWDRVYSIKTKKNQPIVGFCAEELDYVRHIRNPHGCAKRKCNVGCP